MVHQRRGTASQGVTELQQQQQQQQQQRQQRLEGPQQQYQDGPYGAAVNQAHEQHGLSPATPASPPLLDASSSPRHIALTSPTFSHSFSSSTNTFPRRVSSLQPPSTPASPHTVTPASPHTVTAPTPATSTPPSMILSSTRGHRHNVSQAFPMSPRPMALSPSAASLRNVVRWIRHKPSTTLLLFALSSLALFFFWSPRKAASPLTNTPNPNARNFHLLIPASSGNHHLCRLLFSGLILNYPPPILINWDAIETDDVFDMHMSKIDQTMAYLEAFPPEQDHDLALMVDGYDVWFQLPPEVLLRRYFDTIKELDDRLVQRLGQHVVRENDFRHTILFGPDKMCWPNNVEEGRLACWAVPESTMPRNAFGPLDDMQLDFAQGAPFSARPMWLNSGTIMGPIGDLRALFEAVTTRVRTHRQGSSDQFYFAEIWGQQEYTRRMYDPAAPPPPPDVTIPHIDELGGAENKTEYHVGLDYASSMFFNLGYNDPYASWLQFDGSVQSGRPKDAPPPEVDQFELASDIQAARAPLAALRPADKSQLSDHHLTLLKNPSHVRFKQWSELPLMTNLISKHVAPVIHFTIEKTYRSRWWDRMWFSHFSKELYRASALRAGTGNDGIIPLSKGRINGSEWVGAQEPVIAHDAETKDPTRRDGAWTDKGKWMSWGMLCQAYDEKVFGADAGPIYNEEQQHQ